MRRGPVLLALALAALAGGGVVGVVEVRAARAPVVFELPGTRFARAALSNDGEALAVLTRGSGVQLWHVAPGASPESVVDDARVVSDLCFERDGDTLLLLDHSGARRFSWRAGVREKPTPPGFGWGWACLAPGGERAIDAFFMQGWFDLRVWDVRANRIERTIPKEADASTEDAVGLSPSGELAYRHRPGFLHLSPAQPGPLRVWSVRDGRKVAEVLIAPGEIVRTVLDPGDRYVCEISGVIQVRAVATNALIRSFPAPCESDAPRALAVSSDGELIAIGANPLEVRSLRTGALVAALPAPGARGGCLAVAFDRAGDRVAAVWPGKAFVWRVAR